MKRPRSPPHPLPSHVLPQSGMSHSAYSQQAASFFNQKCLALLFLNKRQVFCVCVFIFFLPFIFCLFVFSVGNVSLGLLSTSGTFFVSSEKLWTATNVYGFFKWPVWWQSQQDISWSLKRRFCCAFCFVILRSGLGPQMIRQMTGAVVEEGCHHYWSYYQASQVVEQNLRVQTEINTFGWFYEMTLKRCVMIIRCVFGHHRLFRDI